jgi:hypothetical protein
MVEIVTENRFIAIHKMDRMKPKVKQAVKSCIHSIIAWMDPERESKY